MNSFRDNRRARAFTIVELIVVVAIIGLILGIGLPAFSAMSSSSRLAKARQLINGTLTRAHAISLADRNLIAVRFMPGGWDMDESDKSATAMINRGSQVLTTYRYVSSAQNETGASGTNVTDVRFSERFERLKNGPSAVLPADVWAVPAEALSAGSAVLRSGTSVPFRDVVLSGTIGQFEINADVLSEPATPTSGFTQHTENLLDADDFLVVFDPESGLVDSRRRSPWRMLGYDPRTAGSSAQRETAWQVGGNGSADLTNPFQRFAYTGVALYPRENFVALGRDAAPGSPQVQQRLDYLTRLAKKFFVSRTTGDLIDGSAQ